ncbi:MAG: protein kinase, partial [Armatimonadetes bacterium]|nr:protein kinase [Armatimonadota bacterium]
MSAVPEHSGSGRLIPGTLLDDRYEIQRLLNSGGMGAVYLAFDSRLQIPCAIKQMFSVYSGDELQFVSEHFQQEAQLLARLHHPGIPRVLDYFQLPGESQYFLVMDYIEGKDLGTMIREREGAGFPEETVTRWAVSVLDILIFLHGQPRPILHRDLKPSNIMIAEPGRRVVLIDFGLAKTVNPESTSQKSFVGTWGYAPMEQCQGHPEPRSDLYALGATMHFLLSGKESLPFNFDPIRKQCPDVSEKMEQILIVVLQGAPEGRFASAADMKEALLGVLPQDKFPPPAAGSAVSGSLARPATPGNFLSEKSLAASTEQRSLFSVSGKLRKESDVIDAARAIEMGKAGNPKAVGKLMEVLLFGADADIRQQAAWALGKLK